MKLTTAGGTVYSYTWEPCEKPSEYQTLIPIEDIKLDGARYFLEVRRHGANIVYKEVHGRGWFQLSIMRE